MSTPDRRDDDFLSALLDGAARLDDPIRMAAALDELRAGQTAAPAALRERVDGFCRREVRAAQERVTAPPRLRRRWRHPALVAAGVVCALGVGLLAASTHSPRSDTPSVLNSAAPAGLSGTSTTQLTTHGFHYPKRAAAARAPDSVQHAPTATAGAGNLQQKAATLQGAPGRLQHYEAELRLRVPTQNALSHATQSAMRTTRSLGGYVVNVDLQTPSPGHGTSYLDLRVPVQNIQAEVARLSALGTITAQHVAISDLQGQYTAVSNRVDGLRQSIAVLSARLSNTSLGSVERVQLLGQRYRAQQTLNRVVAQQRVIAHRGAYANVSVGMQVGKAVVAAPKPGHSTALGRAVRGALGVVAAIGVAAAYGAIVLSPLIVLALLAALVWRTLRRRGERRLLQV
jgi:hypothetical protein